MAHQAILMLEDGRVFAGEGYGAEGTVFGEIVFNTSMTGYQEVLTDPSYTGQIVSMTYPLIGNYGANAEDEESDGPRVAGFVIHEAPPIFSNWRATESLEQYLRRNDVVGIAGVDTRALTRHIRSAGSMRGAIAPATVDHEALLAQILAAPEMTGLDLACAVSTEERYVVPARGEKRFSVLAFDFGVKSHSLQLLAERGCEVTVIPADHSTGGDPGGGRGRALRLQRSRRPGSGGSCAGCDPRAFRAAHSGFRNLPRPSADRARFRRKDVQAAVRTPGREPSGPPSLGWRCGDHRTEPRIRGGR